MPQTGGAINRPPKPKKAPKPKTLPATDTSVGGNTNAGKAIGPPTLSDIPKSNQIGGKNNPSKVNKKGNVVPKASSSKAYKKGFTNEQDYTKGGTIKQAAAKRLGLSAKGASVRPGPERTGGARQVMGTQVQRKTTVGGTYRGGSSFDYPNKPPVRVDRNDRVGPTPVTAENPPAYFDRGGNREGGAGGGTGGATNPLNAGSDNLKGKDLEGILHGAKRRGRVRLARGTE